MKKLNLSRLKWRTWKSPRGKFVTCEKELTKALAGKKSRGGNPADPFDVALVRVPPGRTNWPKHSHTTQWEFFLVLNGRGQVNVDREKQAVGPGDFFMQAPGHAHHIVNTGTEDLVYYLVANNPPADICFYPNSNKWAVDPQGKVFRLKEAGYWDGEE